MSVDIDYKIRTKRLKKSRLESCNFNNLSFGSVFSDHMVSAKYRDGEWHPEIIPYGSFKMFPSSVCLHYGQTVFEGMKAFSSEMGSEKILFRPWDNAKRINISAERMCMPTIPEALFLKLLTMLVDIDRKWVPTIEKGSLYIRPFMFATDNKLGVDPSRTYNFMIITSPSSTYYAKPVKLKVERFYTRATPGGTGHIKAGGNYGGAMLASQRAIRGGFDQVIWTDSETHSYIEEVGTMNIMFIIDGRLISPKVGDSILDGITRRCVITLAKDWGLQVEERKTSVYEVIKAIKEGRLTEAFGVGTAAVISQIESITEGEVTYTLPPCNKRMFSNRVIEELRQLVSGHVDDIHGWLVKV